MKPDDVEKTLKIKREWLRVTDTNGVQHDLPVSNTVELTEAMIGLINAGVELRDESKEALDKAIKELTAKEN